MPGGVGFCIFAALNGVVLYSIIMAHEIIAFFLRPHIGRRKASLYNELYGR